ncbi:MAG: hypothetical protein KF773_31465 [Deltaproteobacteria bacterium]|nr:hypothetical protein [Deltaproteobacteria bacterium]
MILADGAGGTTRGDVAAQAIVDAVTAAGATADPCALLAEQAIVDAVTAAGATADPCALVAAQAIVDAVTAAGATADPCTLLAELDADGPRLGHGQSTAVIVAVSAAGVTGAGVGDAGAWVIAADGVVDLTAGQVRKPLVGDGCLPRPISAPALGTATLLVASDGLLALRQGVRHRTARAARALVELVRLPNGTLQDDVGIVLCRHVRHA